ncbi:MAG TPA: hypothetical protein VFU02_05720 [Polyangiaceae bacterium]|nr:hypothetical protein [Polyangiaceae bacterium]
MFWVALSTLLMVMTGQGDDTYVFREFLENLREGVERHVADPARRARAVAVVDDTSQKFRTHREQVNQIGACLERADRRYQTTANDYEHCLRGAEQLWDKAADALIVAERNLAANITEGERRAIQAGAQVETP